MIRTARRSNIARDNQKSVVRCNAALLIDAGADVNARWPGDLSALESAKSVESALLFLRAGALLPEDPARLKKLSTWSSNNNAQTLLREIEERAAIEHR
jgi:hypothetical protein